MTFVLALLCLGTLAYAAVAYILFSFRVVPDYMSVPMFLIRQRTALSALAMTIGLSCVIMGFAVFMIGAKGEFTFKAESSLLKGALVSGVPGLFFVLCGTIVTVSVLFARVTYEQNPASAAAHAASPTVSDGPQVSSRTVASGAIQRIALYTTETPIYNDLMEIGDPGPFGGAMKHLIENETQLSVVMIEWDEQAKKPLSFQGRDLEHNDARVSVSSGYLFVLDSDNAETIKAVLKAADSVQSNFPATLHFSEDSLAKIVRAGLSNRQRFTRGERGM